jgi:hypothetical protein
MVASDLQAIAFPTLNEKQPRELARYAGSS